MDTQKFREHMWQLTTSGFTMVSVTFGNELGLFDIMQNSKAPLTSAEIADKAGLKERYVREWLGGMTAAQIVTIDDVSSKYSIDEGHYTIIKNTACMGQCIRTCISRFDMIKQFFKTSGPWGCDFDQDDWWKFFEDYQQNNCEASVTRDILPSLECSSLSQIGLETGIQILDIGCGTGPVTFAFAKRFTKSSLTGLDKSEKGLKLAMERACREDVSNIRFITGNAQNLPREMTHHYDIVLMFDFLHNLPDPNKALVEAKRVLKPGGKLIIYDSRVHSKHYDNVGDMTAAYLYTFSIFFCLPCSLSGESKVGYGEGWGEEEMMKTIGTYFMFERKFDYAKLQGLFIYSN